VTRTEIPAGLAAPPAAAAVMAKAAGENFPVASRVLPRRQREHLLALYGFARLVDDAGDEAPGDRRGLLDWLDEEVDRVYDGEPTHPLMRRLATTVRACAIPPDPLRALIAANRQDQDVHEYETIDDLLGYCALSANPVGHLVLHVFDAATPERLELSDAVCSGLQLVEHWQDVGEDLERGRVYLPREDLRRFGVTRDDLAAPTAGEPLRRLLAFEVARARQLLDRGAPLIRTLRGRPALAVAAFVAGGRSALDAIAGGGYDVLGATPRPTRRRRAAALARTLARRA
jgi:squalene synthase HpnC